MPTYEELPERLGGLERVPTGIEGLDPLIEGGFPKGSLILLAGTPGTGKTVFGFKFLLHGASELGDPSLLVSFGEGKENIIENMAYHLNCSRDDLNCVEVLDFVTVKDTGIDSLMETIVEKIDSLNARRLVIDPFSAMAYAFKEKIEVRILVHIISKLIKQTGCTTILISETPLGSESLGAGAEEFVADGVIRLRRKIMDGRVFREMDIIKMRGTRLKRHRYLFTLERGFRVFPQFTFRRTWVKREFAPLPDIGSYYSSGSGDLDELLGGGWPRGSVNILEAEADVDLDAYRSIISITGLNFVTKGRRFLTYDPLRFGTEHLKEYLEPFVGEEEFNRLVRCLPTSPSEPRTLKEALSEASAYIFLSLDALTYNYGESQALRTLLSVIEGVRQKGGLILLGTLDGEPQPKHVRALSTIANIHLKVAEMDGVALIYGVKPKTGYYVMEVEPSKGFPELRLTPIL
ncbi:MAG: hypothetical protein AYL32_008080 [Candidatus Bathyarchaeota archaeon B26-2]|nr:MAG: hypothetical protein AYL32_008080 [Candidatus Bathyarchaeota archaeon B26-2]